MGQIQLEILRQANMAQAKASQKCFPLGEPATSVHKHQSSWGRRCDLTPWHKTAHSKKLLLAVVPLLPCSDFLWIRAMYMRSDPLQCTCGDDSLLVHRHRSPPGSSLYCPESSANSAHECRNGYNYNKHGLHRHGPDCIDVQKYQEGHLHLTEHIT